MEQVIPHGVDVDAIVEELRSGERGFVVVPGVFSPEEIAEARERILALIDSQGEKATHFQGSDDEDGEGESVKKLSSRVWNLLNKGKVMSKVYGKGSNTRLFLFSSAMCRFLGTSSIIPSSPKLHPVRINSKSCETNYSFHDQYAGFLGQDFQLGSVASNTIFPGGSGQEPHIDYPYWDYFKSENWPAAPKHKDIPFFMNLQVQN